MDGGLETEFRYNSSDRVLGPRARPRVEIAQEREIYGRKLSLIITDQCNIACVHCLPSCTGKETDYLDEAAIFEIIDCAALAGIQTICFTGGEPFLKLELLAKAIRRAVDLGLVTTVMSNGYWAATHSKALRVLRQLPGLTRLGISTDVFHQAFVPIDKVINAIKAAHELRLFCAVRLTHLNNPDAEIAELQAQLESVAGLYELEHQPVQPLGRAETDIPYEKIFSYDVTLASCRSADVHAVNPGGGVSACCGASGEWAAGHPLDLGSVHHGSVTDILKKANLNPAVHAVRLWGSAGLVEIAVNEARRQGKDLPRPAIQNLCELCKFVNTETSYRSFLEAGLMNPEVRRRIAIARLVEFAEADMVSEI